MKYEIHHSDFPKKTAAYAFEAAGLSKERAAMFLDIGLPFELRDYQIQALNFLILYRRSGLFAEARTGKTIVFVLFAIYCARYAERSCITMPPILFDEFGAQFEELEGDLPIPVYFRHPVKRRKALLEKWRAENSFPSLMVMTKDIFRIEYENLKHEYNILVVDESHLALQSETTKFYEVLSDFVSQPQKRLILSTGTPASSELYGIFPTISLLNPEAYDSRDHFNRQHVIFKQIKVTTRRGRNMLQPVPSRYIEVNKIWRNLYRYGIRVRRSEVLSFKEPQVQGFTISLDSKHMKAYKDFMRTRILEFEDRLISAKQEQKLRSISSQMIVSPQAFMDGKVKNNVLEAVDQIIDMNGVGPEDKCIVFASYRQSVRTLIEHFNSKGIKAVSVYGENSAKTNSANVKKFQNNDDCNVIVINPASGGVGLRLPMATVLIFAEIPLSYGQFDQAVSRAIIDGKEKPTLVYLLQVKGTTHFDDAKKLAAKSEPIRRVNNDAKTLLSAYHLD